MGKRLLLIFTLILLSHRAVQAAAYLGSTQQWVKALNSNNPQVQIKALISLAEMEQEASPAVRAIAHLLASPNCPVREKAAYTLTKVGPAVREVLPSLMKAIRTNATSAKRSCTNAAYSFYLHNAVSQAGSDAVPVLLDALKDRNTEVRIKAMEILAKVATPDSLSILAKAMYDAEPLIRKYAIEGIGKVKMVSRHTLDGVVSALTDEDFEVRAEAAMALGKLGVNSTNVLDALNEALKDRDENVRLQAYEALKELGSPEALTLYRQGKFTDDQGSYLQAKKVQVEEEETVESLMEKIKDPISKKKAIVALGGMGSKAVKAVPALVKCLNDRECTIGARAAEALGKIKNPSSIPALIKALENFYEETRINSAISLSEIGVESLKPLLKAMKTHNIKGRAAAAFSLGKLARGLDLKQAEMAVKILAAELKRNHPETKKFVSEALRKFGTLEALEALQKYDDASSEISQSNLFLTSSKYR